MGTITQLQWPFMPLHYISQQSLSNMQLMFLHNWKTIGLLQETGWGSLTGCLVATTAANLTITVPVAQKHQIVKACVVLDADVGSGSAETAAGIMAVISA